MSRVKIFNDSGIVYNVVRRFLLLDYLNGSKGDSLIEESLFFIWGLRYIMEIDGMSLRYLDIVLVIFAAQVMQLF